MIPTEKRESTESEDKQPDQPKTKEGSLFGEKKPAEQKGNLFGGGLFGNKEPVSSSTSDLFGSKAPTESLFG